MPMNLNPFDRLPSQRPADGTRAANAYDALARTQRQLAQESDERDARAARWSRRKASRREFIRDRGDLA